MRSLLAKLREKIGPIRWGSVIGLTVSAIFLYISFRNLQPQLVWEAFVQAKYLWIVPGVVLYLLALVARTARWRQILSSERRIRLLDLLPTMAMGRGANNIYPFRTGEIVRILILRQRNGVPASTGLASILVERIFDGLTMILFLILAALIGGIPVFLRYVVWVAILFFGAALAAVYAVVLWPGPIRGVGNTLIHRLAPERFEGRLRGVVDSFISGLASVKSVRTLTLVLLFSVAVWTAETVSYRLLMNAFGFSVSFHQLLLMSGAANLGTALPSGPGNVGTFDAPAIEVLTRVGIDRDVAFSYQVVLHAVLWCTETFYGLYFMWRTGLVKADLDRPLTEQMAGPQPPAPVES